MYGALQGRVPPTPYLHVQKLVSTSYYMLIDVHVNCSCVKIRRYSVEWLHRFSSADCYSDTNSHGVLPPHCIKMENCITIQFILSNSTILPSTVDVFCFNNLHISWLLYRRVCLQTMSRHRTEAYFSFIQLQMYTIILHLIAFVWYWYHTVPSDVFVWIAIRSYLRTAG